MQVHAIQSVIAPVSLTWQDGGSLGQDETMAHGRDTRGTTRWRDTEMQTSPTVVLRPVTRP